MIYSYEKVHHNFWHYTVESILPIIDNLDKMMPGDIILVPKSTLYPLALVKRIVAGMAEIVPTFVTEADLDKWVPGYLMHTENIPRVRGLCGKLLSYIYRREIRRPCIYMSFRLHNRRWRPVQNIAALIDKLYPNYNIVLSLNPKWESAQGCGQPELPNIRGGIVQIFDLSYEEQLGYAASCDYAIYVNGAGMVFPQIVGVPSVMLTPCLVTETSVIDIACDQTSYNNKIIVLSDKLPLTDKMGQSMWNHDILHISVVDVLKAFETVKGRCK